MKKYLSGFGVILMLFILPAGSWYYLQSGYDFRMQALKELEPKDPFPQIALELDENVVLDSMVSVVCFCEDVSQSESEILDALEEKYDSRGFQIIRLTQETGEYQTKEYRNLSGQFSSDLLVLVDKERRVRSSYNFESEQIKLLVKHVAIVLPQPKRTEVKLKREG